MIYSANNPNAENIFAPLYQIDFHDEATVYNTMMDIFDDILEKRMNDLEKVRLFEQWVLKVEELDNHQLNLNEWMDDVTEICNFLRKHYQRNYDEDVNVYSSTLINTDQDKLISVYEIHKLNERKSRRSNRI